MTILPVTYLGCTEYFARLLSEECIIDTGENWIKQSARNRTSIVTPNGTAELTVHVVGRGERMATRDVRIDYSRRWQHQHFTALMSSYKKSPYYDFYIDLFRDFYSHRQEFLAEYDIELTRTILRALGSKVELRISDSYVTATEDDTDLRGKKRLLPANAMATPPYTQVFADRMPFVKGLSVIDLLFVEGPDSTRLLRLPPR